jgi:hypothetical protein
MKTWRAIALTALLLWSVGGWASEDIPADFQAAIDAAGVPAYPGAKFCTGNPAMGMRLATSDSVETVRQWYRDQLPEWNTYEEYGGWILYAGTADAGMAEIFGSFQVSINEHPELPQWHDLPSDMTTEIVIALPVAED